MGLMEGFGNGSFPFFVVCLVCFVLRSGLDMTLMIDMMMMMQLYFLFTLRLPNFYSKIGCHLVCIQKSFPFILYESVDHIFYGPIMHHDQTVVYASYIISNYNLTSGQPCTHQLA